MVASRRVRAKRAFFLLSLAVTTPLGLWPATAVRGDSISVQYAHLVNYADADSSISTYDFFSLPYTQTAVNGGSQTSATATFSGVTSSGPTSEFDMNYDSVVFRSNTTASEDVFFTVGPNPLSYTATAVYAYSAPYSHFQGALVDVTQGRALYNYDIQYYDETGTLTLGTSGLGDSIFDTYDFEGNLSGTLVAGHQYEFASTVVVQSSSIYTGLSSSLSGSSSLVLGDVTAPLPAPAVAGFSLLGGVGMMRAVRRRKARAA